MASKTNLLADLLTPRPTSSDVPGYSKWLPLVSPEYVWTYPHLAYIRKHLADVTLGACRKLIINMPPQHGKTEGVTVRYPVWRLLRDPSLRVAITSYGQRQANKYSRKARRIAAEVVRLDPSRTAVDEWETAAGGGLIARGVGAGITGNAVDLLIVDDPYKDAKQALSPTYRDTVWDWWTDSLKTRLSKDAAVVVIHTRWHSDDLTARLVKQGDWRVVELTAVAEPGDPLGREPGQPLCPDLHPLAKLEESRRENPTSFAALFQQRPLDLEGGFFRGLERVPVVGATPAGPWVRRVRFWDLAATEAQAGADPDYTVGVLMGKHQDGRYWVLDVVRGRWGPRGVRDVIRQTAAADGTGVPVRVEREGGASGKLVADLIAREDLAGYPARSVQPDGSKAERAEPWASQIEAGNVSLVQSGWVTDLLAEHRTFPTGGHDDIVDACSGAFKEVARPEPELRLLGR